MAIDSCNFIIDPNVLGQSPLAAVPLVHLLVLVKFRRLTCRRAGSRRGSTYSHSELLRMPHNNQRISSEFDDVSTMCSDHSHELSKVSVQNSTHFLQTERTFAAELFGEHCETGNVGHHADAWKRLTPRHARAQLPAHSVLQQHRGGKGARMLGGSRASCIPFLPCAAAACNCMTKTRKRKRLGLSCVYAALVPTRHFSGC